MPAPDAVAITGELYALRVELDEIARAHHNLSSRGIAEVERLRLLQDLARMQHQLADRLQELIAWRMQSGPADDPLADGPLMPISRCD